MTAQGLPMAVNCAVVCFRYAAGPSTMIGSLDAHQNHKSQHDDDVH
jgi:hypothetical protein